MITCASCFKQIDEQLCANTYCSECKKDFCDAYNHTCFTDYHRKEGCTCRGTAMTILDPTWKINLVNSKK